MNMKIHETPYVINVWVISKVKHINKYTFLKYIFNFVNNFSEQSPVPVQWIMKIWCNSSMLSGFLLISPQGIDFFEGVDLNL